MRLVFLFLMAVLIPAVPPLYAEKSGFEFGEYLTTYYQHPDPAKAPEMLEAFIRSDFFTSKRAYENDAAGATAYMFGRIAGLNPQIKEEYKKVFERAGHEGRVLVLDVFQYCSDAADAAYFNAKKKDPAYAGDKDSIDEIFAKGVPRDPELSGREIKMPDEIDYFWGEFFITGDTAVVRKIMNVIGLPDQSRAKIEAYLSDPASDSKSKEKVRRVLQRAFDVRTDSDGKILTQDDIDISISLGLLSRDEGEAFGNMSEILKFNEPDMDHLELKGEAAWSLSTRAEYHEKILRALEAMLPEIKGRQLIRAALVCAYAEMERDEDSSAEVNLKRVLELDPTNISALDLMYSLAVKKGDKARAEKYLDAIRELNPVLAEEIVHPEE